MLFHSISYIPLICCQSPFIQLIVSRSDGLRLRKIAMGVSVVCCVVRSSTPDHDYCDGSCCVHCYDIMINIPILQCTSQCTRGRVIAGIQQFYIATLLHLVLFYLPPFSTVTRTVKKIKENRNTHSFTHSSRKQTQKIEMKFDLTFSSQESNN